MTGPDDLLYDRQRPFLECHRLVVVFKSLPDPNIVGEDLGGQRMVGAEVFFTDLERPRKTRFRLGAPLRLIRHHRG